MTNDEMNGAINIKANIGENKETANGPDLKVAERYSQFFGELPKGWILKKFCDILSEPVRNGVYKKKEFHGRGQKIINMGELFAYNFISNQEMKRVELKPYDISKSLVQDGDLLFARRSLILEGSGKCSLVVQPSENLTFESSIIRARPDRTQADSRFYYYLFKSRLGRALMASIATQTAVSGITGSNLMQLKMPQPPLLEQRKIAAILSAYDNLIENNMRRIKILEEMAQALYREWFVEFRFPGHEKVKMVESELGMVPEGWEVDTVENTFAILGGGTPSKNVPDYWQEGTINWYSPTDLTATGSMFMECSGNQISELGLKKSSARLFPTFSVMMTSRATLGVISINTTEACTNQGFITCIPNERFPLYTLLYWLKENVEYFISLGTGATFKEITKGVFKTIELVVPSQPIVTHFEDTVQQFALQILNLQRKNTTLRRTRDLLLPKLISGEVDVEKIDIKLRGNEYS